MLSYKCKKHNVCLSTSTCLECGSREFVESIWGQPFCYRESSVWSTSSSCYLIDGELRRFSVAGLQELDTDAIREAYFSFEKENGKNAFEKYASQFVKCNQGRFEEIRSLTGLRVRN